MTSVQKSEPSPAGRGRPQPKGGDKGAKKDAPAASSSPSEFDVNSTQLADDDPTQGEWLFKQDDLVLGPVTAIVLVEKIKKGELSADTPIARDGQHFRPMKLLPLFREAWMAAEEARRLAAEEKAYQSAMTRARLLRVVIVVVCFAVPAAAAGAGARAVMIARPWDDTADWIAKVPPLVDLPQKPIEVKKEPPPTTVAQNDAKDEEEVEEEVVDPKDGKKTIKKVKKPKDKLAANNGDGQGDGKKDPDAKDGDGKKPSGLPETLTNQQAIEPLKTAAPAMKACFKAEMESNPDMPAQVVLSYTVTEDGKATNIALDARELRGRPVVACVQKAIGALSWPKFSGERKNVSVPFKLGKPPPPKP